MDFFEPILSTIYPFLLTAYTISVMVNDYLRSVFLKAKLQAVIIMTVGLFGLLMIVSWRH
jgi:hypothetical protein